MLSLCLVIQRGMPVTPLNENPVNLEKNTASVLYVLFLIYGVVCLFHCPVSTTVPFKPLFDQRRMRYPYFSG